MKSLAKQFKHCVSLWIVKNTIVNHMICESKEEQVCVVYGYVDHMNKGAFYYVNNVFKNDGIFRIILESLKYRRTRFFHLVLPLIEDIE